MRCREALVAAFLIAISCCGAFASDQIRCAYCRKDITEGSYLTIDGKYYHPEHFLCAGCGNPIGQAAYFVENGQYYDSVCHVELFAPLCAYCGKPIDGIYVTYENARYHDTCYREHVALRCSLCGELIQGEYIIDDWGNSYHKFHQGTAPQCDYCLRFISDSLSMGGTTYPDGRRICGICLQYAVMDESAAKEIMSQIKAVLWDKGIEIEEENIPLLLVDKDKMAKINGLNKTDVTGYTFYERSTGTRIPVTTRKYKIYMLAGLPRSVYIQGIAHELMHVWLYRNASLEMDDTLREGSCNYASYLVLQRYEGKEMEYLIRNMIKDPDRIYGEGFRRVKAWVEQKSVSEWLDYLKHNNLMPQ
ncbi:MAG: protein DA1 [candidate division Zixibacteria bacterium]|nr:protein DA1 [candidate division Zixibacteria bacterium]